MRPIFNIHNLFASLGLVVLLLSCKKDKVEQAPDVVYTVNVDGYTATFNNQTTGGQSFRWDFGDGATSTEASPVHTYPGKGKYVPTLYVTTANGNTVEGSTVLRISKSTAVKIDDNSLADWDTVSHNAISSGAGGGIFKKAKYDYDGNYVYFYFEMTSTQANGDIFDFYMDSDNNPSTGLITWLFGGGGYDVLIEGAVLANWFDLFYHVGAQTAFSFDYQSVSDFYQVGTIKQEGAILKFEGRLSRTKIKGMTGTGFKIGVAATKNDWSATLGTAPDQATAAFFVDMSE
ncbi:MAG: PKD domain-containing protein [Ferruginibacter sp.]|nr:PKD domain-containing protein [Chitinophagaceae bacterium]